jgi:hypothetical protein
MTDQVSKVPVLGDIPVLGYAFKSRKQSKIKTNLLIFITPRIVKSADELAEIYEEEEANRQKSLEEYTKEKKKVFPMFEESRPGIKKKEPREQEEDARDTTPAAESSKPAPEMNMPEVSPESGGREEPAAETPEALNRPGLERGQVAAVSVETLSPSVTPGETPGGSHGVPAEKLVDVAVSKNSGNGVMCRLTADGSIGDYRWFFLDHPTRLVVDVYGVTRGIPGKVMNISAPYVDRIRLGDYADKVRVVLDISGPSIPPHRVEQVDNQVVVLFGDAEHMRITGVSERPDKSTTGVATPVVPPSNVTRTVPVPEEDAVYFDDGRIDDPYGWE